LPATRAKELVSFANELAIASLDDGLLDLYAPLRNAYRSPSLRGRLVWDFFATVAGVGVAFAEIADTVPEAEQEALSRAVVDALTAWNRRGDSALTDFLNFVRQGVTGGAPLPALIGTWIIRNVLRDHRPAIADFELFSNAGSVIGMRFLRAFHGWWQKRAPRRGSRRLLEQRDQSLHQPPREPSIACPMPTSSGQAAAPCRAQPSVFGFPSSPSTFLGCAQAEAVLLVDGTQN
jgi:hypothetical protein